MPVYSPSKPATSPVESRCARASGFKTFLQLRSESEGESHRLNNLKQASLRLLRKHGSQSCTLSGVAGKSGDAP